MLRKDKASKVRESFALDASVKFFSSRERETERERERECVCVMCYVWRESRGKKVREREKK